MNAGEYFAFTGKELSKNLDTIELVEDMIGIDKLKNISSYRDLLKNAKLSDDPRINSVKQRVLASGSDDIAKKVLLNMDGNAFSDLLRNYTPGKKTASEFADNAVNLEEYFSSLPPDIYKDGDFTEEGYRQIFDSLSDEDKINIAMKYGVASAKGVPLEENFAKMIANQKKIDEFLNSKMYDYLETAEAIINEAENFGREFTEDTPNILSGLRSTSSKIQAAVNLAKKLSQGKHTDESLSEVEKTITEIFVDGMERARVNEIRAGIDPKMEDAMHSHRESYVPHIKAAAKNIVQEDKNGNFVPDFSNTKPLNSHKGRKISGTIADINAEALSNGEAKVFMKFILRECCNQTSMSLPKIR